MANATLRPTEAQSLKNTLIPTNNNKNAGVVSIITRKELNECIVYSETRIDLIERIAKLEAELERCTTAYGVEKVQSQSQKGSFEEQVTALEELRTAYEIEKARCDQHVLKVTMAINTLTDAEQKRLLLLRYVDGLLWPDVWKRMGYERSKCYNLHNAGLESLGIS